MGKLVSLKECNIKLIGGQIMSRITTKFEDSEKYGEIKVVIPKSICADGTVNIDDLAEETLKVAPDEKRITKVDDIVLKLSTPYDAAIIDEDSAGCIVPSFCAIIQYPDTIDKYYLLAYLNSETCKEQLKQQVAGATITVLSVGKVSNVQIPLIDIEEQKKIGRAYYETQQKLKLLNEIIKLESERNSIVFNNMVNEYGN